MEAIDHNTFLKLARPKAGFGGSLSELTSLIGRTKRRCANLKPSLTRSSVSAVTAEDSRREQALDPHEVERGFASTLDFENREVEDLENILAGSGSGNKTAAQFRLPLPSWTVARNSRSPKKRPDDISEFAVRRYLERKSSLEELVIALYCGSISVSRAQKTAQALWGADVDIALISRHAGTVEQRIRNWLRRPITVWYPYVYLRTMMLVVGKGGAREWRRVFVAVGVSSAGIREVLSVHLTGAADAGAEEKFIGDLRARGLKATELFLGENEPPLISAVEQHFPGVSYQGDFEQMARNLLQETPIVQVPEIAELLRVIREEESPESARAKLVALRGTLRRSRNTEAERILASALPYLFSFSRFPRTHWARLRENAPVVRVMRDCREWTRVGGAGTTSDDLLLSVAARWRHASRVWAYRRFLTFGA